MEKLRYDQKWDLQKVISHPSCSGIHDILLDHDRNLWITSARNDLLFKFDLRGDLLEYHYFRHNQELLASIQGLQPRILSNQDIITGIIDFRDPRTHKITTHDTVHVNSVT